MVPVNEYLVLRCLFCKLTLFLRQVGVESSICTYMGYRKEETVTSYLIIIDNLKLSNYKMFAKKLTFLLLKKLS